MTRPPMPEHLFSRRRFLRRGFAATAGIYAGFGLGGRRARAAVRYENLQTDRYLGEVRVETKVVDEEVFTEGPAVDRAGNVFFTNVPASKILKWDPREKRLSVFRENSHATNGLLFAPNGDLLACEGDAGRVTRTDMRTGKITIVADRYRGKPFAAPNDLALDAKGRLYFTSRPEIEGKTNPIAVYRVDPDGTVTQLLVAPNGTDMPNGIVTAPDDRTLYLIEAHPDEGHLRNIRAFDLAADGSLSNGRILIDFYPGRSGDGMCIDAEGNLYVAAGLHERRGTSETLDTRPGIHVVSPEGKLLAYRRTPEDTITNCTFGGRDLRTLYVTCGSLLLSIPTRIPGKPSYRPNR